MKNNIFTTKLIDLVIAGSPENFMSIFIIMEMMPIDLKNLMKDPDISFKETHIILTLYNILSALTFIQEAGLIHRDLKPENILINGQC
jgi:serine/threonine protein kinase